MTRCLNFIFVLGNGLDLSGPQNHPSIFAIQGVDFFSSLLYDKPRDSLEVKMMYFTGRKNHNDISNNF